MARSRAHAARATSLQSSDAVADSQTQGAPDSTPIGPLTEEAALEQEERLLDAQLAMERTRARLREKQKELLRLGAPDPEEPVQPTGEEGRQTPSATVSQAPLPISDPDESAPYRHLALPALSYKSHSYPDLVAFLYDCENHFVSAPRHFRTSRDKVAYGIRCLGGAPKLAWIHHASTQQIELGDYTWEYFKAFLQGLISDPETRAFAATERLARLRQKDKESVQDFLDRYTRVELELPYRREEAQRVSSFLLMLREDIGFSISTSAAIPATMTQLVSLAKRVEERFNARGPQPPAVVMSPPKRSYSDQAAQEPRGPATCYGCGQKGHIRRECPQRPGASDPRPLGPRTPAQEQRGLICYSCGQPGLYATGCPGRACRLCGQTGHLASQCTTPAASTVPERGS